MRRRKEEIRRKEKRIQPAAIDGQTLFTEHSTAVS